MKVLFAAAEVYPLLKTGGLADVAAALPAALHARGIDVRVIMPACRGVAARVRELEPLAEFEILGQRIRVFGGLHPDHAVPLLLVDAPALFARLGSPYGHADDAWRFGCFCAAIARIAEGAVDGIAGADLVHLNDWHTGLVPAFFAAGTHKPRTLFTIHNLAYQGRFARADFDRLGLPTALWTPRMIEFHGDFSFLKAGLVLADALTTVSPTYAREIQTPAAGEGLDGVLREREDRLRGILNGIDDRVWNPASDPLIAQTYDSASVVAGKAANKRALRAELGLTDCEQPLLAFIGRLASQKGADALLAARAALSALPIQIVVLASGDPALERGFADWAQAEPGRFAICATQDERLAHLIEAAADLFIMPSRYEPCGLNQMYSQRYGTIPLVHRVGGLADSVDGLESLQPTGIHFEDSDGGGVVYAVRQALELIAQPAVWQRMQQAGMRRDWSWSRPAQEYADLYASLLAV